MKIAVCVKQVPDTETRVRIADGGKGDVIAVLNARSRRTIEGRVSGPGTISVQTSPATLAAAQQ